MADSEEHDDCDRLQNHKYQETPCQKFVVRAMGFDGRHKVDNGATEKAYHVDGDEEPACTDVLHVAQFVRHEKVSENVKEKQELHEPVLVRPDSDRDCATDCHGYVELEGDTCLLEAGVDGLNDEK